MDYSIVTETPEIKITKEALSMLYTRYGFARSFCRDKEVLEVACGAGQGLGFLKSVAKSVIGGDYTGNLVKSASDHYRGLVPVLRLDGHSLPFKNDSFDVIILYEAIYYLKEVGCFLEECRRILRSGGHLLICSANKEWDGFNASPYSHTYFSISELNSILSNYPFETKYYGTFRVSGTSKISGILSVIKRLAVALHLIPKTMKGKEFLKRLFLGTLVQFPVEITEDMADYYNPEPISALSPVPDYKVIYATAKLTT